MMHGTTNIKETEHWFTTKTSISAHLVYYLHQQ